jgi:hypothetical protein
MGGNHQIHIEEAALDVHHVRNIYPLQHFYIFNKFKLFQPFKVYIL